jgi:hypothetical protein
MKGLLQILTMLICLLGGSYHGFSQQNSNPPKPITPKKENQLRAAAIGNVGVGTTVPNEKLHVIDGNILLENDYPFITNNSAYSSNSGMELQEGDTIKGYFWWDGSSDLLKMGTAKNGFYNIINIDEDGGVGMGTQSDGPRLRVQGLTSSTGDALDVENSLGESLLTVRNNGNVGIHYPTPGVRLALDGDMNFYNDNYFYGQIYDDPDSNMVINGKFGTFIIGNSTPARDLILQTNTSPFFFGFPGNVGIGVTAPTAKLHVGSNVMIGSGSPAAGYALSVNGKIMSEEVRVQLDSAWPDYVFEDDYSLTPIPELAKQIQKEKHLPGIPSAEEMENNGLVLGDMQTRMMEKIEELTLYIIQLENRISQIENDK